MKQKTERKLLSFLLSLAMVIGLLPGMGLTANAATLDSNSRTWSEDSEITDDVTISGGVTVSADMTLTIPEGKTLTVNGGINAGGHTMTVRGKGTLKVMGRKGTDGSNDTKGGVGFKGNILVKDGSAVTINGGKGGNGDEGGVGGVGGTGVEGNIIVESGTVTVTGGDGGNGGEPVPEQGAPDLDGGGGGGSGDGTDGGDGGTGVEGDIRVEGGTVTVKGGTGGEPGSDSGNNGTGGYGVKGSITVESGTVTITSGISNMPAVYGKINGANAKQSINNINWSDIIGGSSEMQYVKVDISHIHSFTYSTDGTTIIATCGDTTDCTLAGSEYKATLTLKAPADLAYDDTAKAATLTGRIPGKNPTIVYRRGSETLESAPIEPGDYTASITVDGVSVSVPYTITNNPVDVVLKVSGETNGCTASLLSSGFETVPADFKMKAGETCILSVDCHEGYDYVLSHDFGSDSANECITPLTDEEYQEYIDYCKAQDIHISANMDLYKVTMPPTGGKALNINVNIQKANIYTILYKPKAAMTEVWCKFTTPSGGDEKPFAIKMNPDSTMNGVNVWSAKITAAFKLNKIGFTGSQEGLASASTSESVTCKKSEDWTDITGDQYLVIGGDAKTVTAAFVANGSDKAVRYDITVCPTDGNGNVMDSKTVKAPNAPTRTGYKFLGWRTIQNNKEKICQPNDDITISENTILNAVWKKISPIVKINLNGGNGDDADKTLKYGDKLSITEPAKDGYAFAGWTVAKGVTQSGRAYSAGAAFDPDTPITADLELTAQWKHVHTYRYFHISDLGNEMKAYEEYAPYIHIKFCSSCQDFNLEAHSFNWNGTCACGYQEPGTENATVKISYGQWSGGTYTSKMMQPDRTIQKQTETSLYAPESLGTDMDFLKWQYSTDSGKTWMDLAAVRGLAIVVPCNMELRALYVNPVNCPEINLSTRTYYTPVEYNSQTYYVDTLLFQMDYQLPDGYTYVDSGIRMGDNDGISYYELKEVKYSASDKMGKDLGMGMFFGGVEGALNMLADSILGEETPEPRYYYDNREDSVLNLLTAETLSEYMLNFKPVNVEKYPPIYWETKSKTKAKCGELNTIAPEKFAWKNNKNHYIYGMAYLQYKERDGTFRTICTDAIAATLENINELNMADKVKTKKGS